MQITKRSLNSWIFHKNCRLQAILLGVILVTVFARVVPLEMQKRIINQAIGLGQTDKLLVYCGLYLGAVLLASTLKYVINCLQVYIGQQTLMRIRKELYLHIIQLPLSFFRQTQPGVVISSLVNELTTISSFAGSAVAVPVANILTIVAFAGYMFYLNPLLAGLSFIIFPLEMLVIPKLQRRANTANRTRIRRTRRMSSLVGETVTGIHEVHAHGGYMLEQNKFSTIARKMFQINLRHNMFRYGIKVTDNLFQGLSPFLLFLVGGYLTIQGRFDLGALIAFLSASANLHDPWRELMDFYQLLQDSKVRYAQVMESFDLAPLHALAPVQRDLYDFKGAIVVRDLTYTIPGNIALLDRVCLRISQGEHLALVGFSGSGKSSLARVIAQLYDYSEGNVLIDGREVTHLTRADMAENIGMVSQHPFIFSGALRENLFYACAARNLNHPSPIMPDQETVITTIKDVGLLDDIVHFGLTSTLAETTRPDLEGGVIRVRKYFQKKFGKKLSDDLEFFDETSYLMHLSVSENIIFGDPQEPSFTQNQLHANESFLTFLRSCGLKNETEDLGVRIARETIDILGTLSPTPEFFQATPMPLEEFENYRNIIRKLDSQKISQLDSMERDHLLKLALAFTPGIHKMLVLPKAFQIHCVRARHLFKTWMQQENLTGVVFIDRSTYIHSQTILANIVFGRLKQESAGARERIQKSLMNVLVSENLLDDIISIGLDFEVGSMGDRLSGGQQQKLALARALLKAPPILILDEATSALDNISQTRIQNLLESKLKGTTTVISVVHRLDTLPGYDRIAVMKSGRIVETGTYDTLLQSKGVLHELIRGTH